MDASKVFGWVEDHPYAAAAIGVIGLFIILWLLGFFSSSKASESGGGNMASAYYAAEAAQAQAGAQIQTTQIQATAATSIANRQAQMTEAVAATQANAATIINGQNTGAAVTINAQDTGAQVQIDAQQGYTQRVISNDQLQATNSTNYWTAQTAFNNNATALAVADTNNRTSVFNNLLNNVIPAEIAAGYGKGTVYDIRGFGGTSIAIGNVATPDWARSVGYSEDAIRQLWG